MNSNFALFCMFMFTPALIFFILEKLFKLKTKLIKQFKTSKRYKLTICLFTFIPILCYLLYGFITNAHFNYLIYSLLSIYYYLIYIPEELR